MVAERRLQEAKIAAFARELSQVESLSELRVSTLAQLRKLVGCEIASYNEIGPRSEEVFVVADPEETLRDTDAVEGFRQYLHQNPLIERQRATPDGRTLRLSDFITRKRLHELELYHFAYRHIGVEHQLAFTLPSRGQVIGVTVSRSGHDFSEHERGLVDAVSGIVRASHRNLHDRACLQLMTEALDVIEDGPTSVAIVQASGTVQPAHERAARLLDRIACEPEASDTFTRWAHSKHRDGERLGAPELRLHTGDGQLRALYIYGPAGEPDAIALQQLPLRDPAALRSLNLTARQAEVLHLVWQGASNTEIARMLGISVHTVRHHLEDIYARLQVNSRTAAAHVAARALAMAEAVTATPRQPT